ncbi:MAG: PP2C family protein-serine/threonine phosphatase [Thermoanaerobaculia bacterium]
MLDRRGFLVGFAVFGLALTAAAVSWWSPEATTLLTDTEAVARRAVADAESLRFQVGDPGRPRISSGPRFYPAATDIRVAQEQVADPDERRLLMAAAPTLRMGVKFWDAVGADGSPGVLLLEYGSGAQLVAASFGWDGVVQTGLQPYAGRDFADETAARLLGEPAPEPEILRLGGGYEYIYPAPGPGRPGVYVYLGGSARWIAALQPVPYALLTRQFTFVQNNVAVQAFNYLALALFVVLVGTLLWRLSRRRAGFGHIPFLGSLLLLGLLPILGNLPAGVAQVNLGLIYALISALILLLWTVAEAELREIRPGSIEHWDRLVRRKPIASTGRALLIGVLFGLGLAGIPAATGRLAEVFGGGYAGLLLILPEYWFLPTPLGWGLAVAAITAFLISFGRRLAGRTGAIVGAALGGLAWAFTIPAAPFWWCAGLGIVLSLAAGWLMTRHGLVALTTASITAVSLPTMVILLEWLPQRSGTFLLSAFPAALAVLGVVLMRWAPRAGGLESVKPAYVSELEHDARLAGEVELLREFQLSLLPAVGAAAKFGAADIAWKMIPADTVGGDFLDLLEDDAGRIWIAIADAAGHGISCSVLTAFTKAAVTDHVGADVGPGEALARIRRLFGRLRTRRSMVTLLLAVWDPTSRRLTVANSGHPPLLVHDGGIREVGRSSSPLGTALEGDAEEEVIELGDGAVVVAFTDGAPEAVAPSGETFGYERWSECLAELAGGSESAAGILERLLADVELHRAGRRAEDDLTAVVLKLA